MGAEVRLLAMVAVTVIGTGGRVRDITPRVVVREVQEIAPPPPPPTDPALLLESGDYLLLESGDKILLE